MKKKTLKQLEAENKALKHIAVELHWMARRYADGRETYAPHVFNNCTRKLLALGVEPDPMSDKTIWATNPRGRDADGLTEEEATLGTPESSGEHLKGKGAMKK